jgi:hypothetical protein
VCRARGALARLSRHVDPARREGSAHRIRKRFAIRFLRCSILTMTWPMRGARVVPVAARSTPAGISAGPEACRPGSTTRRIVGGSASAARWMGAASRHAAVAAVSGAPGVPCHHGGADLGDAARRNTPASGAPVAAYGVSQRTIARGQEWWRTAFSESRFWQAKRAVLMPPIDQARLPASLLARFAGSGAEQLLALLRFLAPISGGAIGHAW